MEKIDRIRQALNDALRRRAELEVTVLRMVLSTLKDREIALRGTDKKLDEEFTATLRSMVKKRRESAELYKQGGRDELAERELQEITILEAYLPQAMSREQTADAVDQAIRTLGGDGGANMGKIMGLLKSTHAQEIDMKVAGEIVRQRLSQGDT